MSLNRRLGLTDSYGVSRLGFAVYGLLALTALGIALFCLILFPSRAVGRTTCRHWSTQTGFASKFVLLNWADTGTCLAQAPNGRWVKNTQIVQFIQAGSK